ncbi:MAG TPA: ATP-binding protein [Gemmatimonadales bacterium]|nr:ATP-binding protein [Gemmatimonadales bacterium]
MSVDVVEESGAGFRHMEKMGAVTRVAQGLSHDVAELVEDAASTIDVALTSGVPEDRLAEAASTLKRVAMIARQLEAISRPLALHAQPRPVGGAIAEMLPLLRRLAGDGVAVMAPAIDEAAWAAVATGQLEQVAFHLTVNARDAMPGGGTLTVTVRRDRLDQAMPHRFGSLPAGAWVVLEISDTGVGMDEAMLARIFEPFFTTKAPGLGSGLGLATVYGIARQLGGQVVVASAPGTGSRFGFWLPEVLGVEADPDVAGDRNSAAILVVDDDEWVRSVTTRSLKRAGHGTLEAATATEAIRILDDVAGCCIGTVITDIGMPGTSGVELAAQLHQTHPHLRIVLMTGRAPEAVPPLQSPVAAVLYKPFSRRELLAALRESPARLS